MDNKRLVRIGIALVGTNLLVCSCTVGPLVLHETGRTVGRHHNELELGAGSAGQLAKWNFGLADDLDVGIQYEMLSVGARVKYAFINRPDHGLSLAGAAGAGRSRGGHYYNGDLVASYLNGPWEPYGGLRYTYAKSDPDDLNDKDSGIFDFTIHSDTYEYGQTFVGSRYWFNPNWLLSVEASSLFSLSDSLRLDNNFLLGLALGYRF